MKERPILFSGPMVRAIDDGRKTQTRRVIKPQSTSSTEGVYADLYNGGPEWAYWLPDNRMDAPRTFHCPYGKPGDRLWVRETWYDNEQINQNKDAIFYRADGEFADHFPEDYMEGRWSPSIHMFRWMSRITLEITDVRAERLQDISEEDALSEGVEPSFSLEAWDCAKDDASSFSVFTAPTAEMIKRERIAIVHHRPREQTTSARTEFQFLWDKINAKRGPWDDNPWVWVVEFKRIDT